MRVIVLCLVVVDREITTLEPYLSVVGIIGREIMGRDFFFVPCESSVACLMICLLSRIMCNEVKWKIKLAYCHDRKTLRSILPRFIGASQGKAKWVWGAL